MRVSAGTASILGLNSIKQIYPPTTAYLLTDGICQRSCGFCGNNKKLARITWPGFDTDLILERLKNCKVQRICLQTVESITAKRQVKKYLPALINLGIPVCLCSQTGEEFLHLGLSRWTVPLDVADPLDYSQIKGGDFYKKLTEIKKLSQKYQGQIGTHLIVGLGETEEQFIRVLAELYEAKVSVGLFAFTPVLTSALENWPRPSLDSYRRIQMANFLLAKEAKALENFTFKDGRLIALPLKKIEKRAFETWGCFGCNRPFYNESPQGPYYNYPRALTEAEFSSALKEAKLSFETDST